MVPINCSQPLLSIVFLLFVYDLGTLLLTVVVRAFIFLFRCSGFLLTLGGTTTPRSPSLDKIVFCATQRRNSMFKESVNVFFVQVICCPTQTVVVRIVRTPLLIDNCPCLSVRVLDHLAGLPLLPHLTHVAV